MGQENQSSNKVVSILMSVYSMCLVNVISHLLWQRCSMRSITVALLLLLLMAMLSLIDVTVMYM